MTALRSIEALQAAGLIASDLPAAEQAALIQVGERYSIAVSSAVAGRIDVQQIVTDPVARQFVPDVRELVQADESLSDPIGDDVHSPLKGLVHRYPDRVLLKATEVCPVYCRFCFRRESVGGNAARPLSGEEFEAIFAYIDAHSEIWEVIVSGGDPLVLSNARLRTLLTGLEALPHVKVVRFHTRVPVVTPERIDQELIEVLRATDKTLYMAIHANHANEFDAPARAACRKLADSGVALLSQSVLLRGVNDDVQTLGELMRTFVELKISPYYLHQLDLAPGTEHFRVPIREGQALLRAFAWDLVWVVSAELCDRFAWGVWEGFGGAGYVGEGVGKDVGGDGLTLSAVGSDLGLTPGGSRIQPSSKSPTQTA